VTKKKRPRLPAGPRLTEVLMSARNLSRRGDYRNAVPLSYKGMELVVVPIGQGRLAPALGLRVRGARGGSVGVTVPARHADELARLIVDAGRRASETFAMSPVEPRSGPA